MTAPLLAVDRLTVRAGQTTIVENASFTLARGGTLAVVGESGSGKSTLAHAITGLLPHGLRCSQETRVRFAGEAMPLGDRDAMRALRGRRICMVFQDPMASLNPFMTVGAQIDEALGRIGVKGRGERRKRLVTLLEEVEFEAAMAPRYPHELSGGQQQRVMIAMALAGGPDLLVADEPTSALDTTTTGEIVALLKRLRREREMATLFISHDLTLAAGAAEVAVMEGGRIVEVGPAANVLGAPREAYTKRLVAARAMLGEPRDAAEPFGAEIVASADGLSVDYPARRLFARPIRVLHDVSASLQAGRTLGILGRSGSGKSTFAKALAAMEPPSGGSVSLLNTTLRPAGPTLTTSERRKVQFVFQNPQGALNPRLTIARTLAEPLQLAGRRKGLREVITYALAEVGLTGDMAARYPHQLSGGQRQRVCIARALLGDPKLLICDEVVASLDATVQAEILALLVRLQAERRFAMAFIGHDIDVVRWIADDLVVMHRGTIVDAFPASALHEPHRHGETRRLLASTRLRIGATQAAA